MAKTATPPEPTAAPDPYAIQTVDQWIAYLQREISFRRWCEGAKGFAEGLQRLEKERAQAEAARNTALADRGTVLAEIDAARGKAEQDALKTRTEQGAMLARDQAQADQALATTQAELKKLHSQIDQTRILVTLSEEQRDAMRADLTREIAMLTAERDTIKAEEQAIRGRLTAALGG